MSNTTLADVQAAERLLTEAQDELKKYRGDPAGWAGCHEYLDREGRKHLNLTDIHLAQLDALQHKVERSAQHLRWIKQEFWGA